MSNSPQLKKAMVRSNVKVMLIFFYFYGLVHGKWIPQIDNQYFKFLLGSHEKSR